MDLKKFVNKIIYLIGILAIVYLVIYLVLGVIGSPIIGTSPVGMGYVSVKDYGAKGDGTTNDTTAIQNAISSGKNVYFPPGTYLCNLNITSTTFSILGSGIQQTILKPYSTSAPVIKVDAKSNQIFGWSIKELQIDGNRTAQGVVLTATYPYAISEGIMEHLLINNCITGLQITGVNNGPVYSCRFSDMIYKECITGIDIGESGAYLSFRDSEITSLYNGPAITTTGGLSLFERIQTSNTINNGGQFNSFQKVTIEGIMSTAPQSKEVFRDAGAHSNVDLVMTNIPPAKCPYGYSAYNPDHNVQNIRMWGTSIPSYPFNVDPSSSGTIINVDVQGDNVSSHNVKTDFAKWNILGGGSYFAPWK